MIKKITTTITTIIEEYPDNNTPELNFKDTIVYGGWIDRMDIFPLKDEYRGRYETSGYDSIASWSRDDRGKINHISLTKFCSIDNKTFRKLKQKFSEYPYWDELKKYQSDLINFKNSFSYDETLDTLTIIFDKDFAMIEYQFNNTFKVFEYYSHFNSDKTIQSLVIPGFRYNRSKKFIKDLSVNYPQYPYWDLIEQLL